MVLAALRATRTGAVVFTVSQFTKFGLCLVLSAGMRKVFRANFQLNGQTFSMVRLSIHCLSSSFRNFMSSRTTFSALSYVDTPSMIGQSVAHMSRCGPNAAWRRFTCSCASSHGYGCFESDQVWDTFTNTLG